MLVHLTRTKYLSSGIFGKIEVGELELCCAEHAYEQDDGTFLPKIPAGQYTCIRRKSPKFGYELFLITGVPNHSWVEIHIGNDPQTESIGCVLLGTDVVVEGETQKVIHSRIAFDKFMDELKYYETIQLVVK